ncbi:hypothetical protein AtEden1_Chr3g0199411 [Arabidopsis thaliana]
MPACRMIVCYTSVGLEDQHESMTSHSHTRSCLLFFKKKKYKKKRDYANERMCSNSTATSTLLAIFYLSSSHNY